MPGRNFDAKIENAPMLGKLAEKKLCCGRVIENRLQQQLCFVGLSYT
jgi:hypothetical protein